MKSVLQLLLGASVCVGSVPAHALGYTVTNLGAIGPSVTLYIDINNAGQVATTITGATGLDEAALWSNGAWQSLSPGASSTGRGLNDLGHVVGSTEVNGTTVATLWKNGKAELLQGFPGEPSAANDINNAGQIVGYSTRSEHFGGPMHVQWNNGQPSYLPGIASGFGWASDINEAGQIAGASRTARFHSAARWDDGNVTELDAPYTYGSALGINSHGTVVGNSDGKGAIWSKDGTLILDQFSGELHDITDTGTAVGFGYFPNPDGYVRALLYQDGEIFNLNDLIVGDRAGLGVLRGAFAINEGGQIVGFASQGGSTDFTHAFLLTPVPEPEHWTMLLVGLGLVCCGARGARRHRAGTVDDITSA